jgi:hypothetical protein
MTQTGGGSIGYWVAIILIVVVMIPTQFAVVYILFRYGIPAIFKSTWQQLRTPAAKRWFVASMIVLVIAEVGLVIWIG